MKIYNILLRKKAQVVGERSVVPPPSPARVVARPAEGLLESIRLGYPKTVNEVTWSVTKESTGFLLFFYSRESRITHRADLAGDIAAQGRAIHDARGFGAVPPKRPLPDKCNDCGISKARRNLSRCWRYSIVAE